MSSHTASQEALIALVEALRAKDYSFTCPSPETQGRVVSRRLKANRHAESLSDFFGWSLPIVDETPLTRWLPANLVEKLLSTGIITRIQDGDYRSSVRISNFVMRHIHSEQEETRPLLYVHSAFPCTSDSVFFGPDTYMFLDFLDKSSTFSKREVQNVVDVCCGAGAGAIRSGMRYPNAQTYGLDLNKQALEFGAVNASVAGVRVEFSSSNLYQALPDDVKKNGVDLIVSNPPYIAPAPADESAIPIYADGGAQTGLELSIRIVKEAVDILATDGVILVYTGVAISVAEPGVDPFLESIRRIDGLKLQQYLILNPDMWTEEIGEGAYAEVGRIQVVGAVLRKIGCTSAAVNGRA